MVFRAALSSSEASIAVENFLRSMQGNQAIDTQSITALAGQFTTLPDLLPVSTTIPLIDNADEAYVHTLLSHLPPTLLLLNQEADDDLFTDSPHETTTAALAALSLDQKKEILRKVLRSPQFSQSLSSLTIALRDGGLPSISDALGIPIENGGFIINSRVPLGGGDAVKAFLDGVKVSTEKENTKNDTMDTN